MFTLGKPNTIKQVPSKPPLQYSPPPTFQQNSQIQSPMSAVPDNRFSLASATTISTARSSIFSTIQGDRSRRSSASTLHSSHPGEDEAVLELALQQKIQYEKSIQEKEFRLVQAHFISQVLASMGYNEHAIVGSAAMVLHGVDTSARSPHKVPANPFGADFVNIPQSIDVLVEPTDGSLASLTVGKLTHDLKRMFVDKLPTWFYLEEDSPIGRLFLEDTTDMLNSITAAAATSEGGENHFMQAIKLAAENPPPPLAPVSNEHADANGADIPQNTAQASQDEYSRKPVEVNIHIAAHPGSPYRWLQSLSLTNNARGNTTTTVVTHKHYHQASSNVLTLQTPSVTLPILLVLTLCNSNYHMRSLKMNDRKRGQKELREAVALSRHMQSKSIRAPASVNIPDEAVRMLERLRGSKGVEEKDLLTWVLRGNKGRRGPHMQLSVEIPKSIGYVPGRNKELRDLTLVKRATIGASVVSGMGPASRQSHLSPVSSFSMSRPVSINIQSPPLPPIDAFALAAISSNRGMSSRETSSQGSSIMEGTEGSERMSTDYLYQRLDAPGVYKRDPETQSVSDVGFFDERGYQGEKSEKRKSWFGGLTTGLGKGRWSLNTGS